MDLDKILTLIRTQNEANDLLVNLNELLANLYSTKNMQLQDYFTRLPKDLVDILLQTIESNHLAKEKNSLKNFISELQDKINACKAIEITIAFKPDDQTITFFSTWTKKNIGTNNLLDIKINKEIVGGAIIIAGGKYRDFSVHKKLAQIFQIQREEIMGLLSPLAASTSI